MVKSIQKILLIVIIVALLLCGCAERSYTKNEITFNQNSYDLIIEHIPEIADMQCTLYKEITITGEEDFVNFINDHILKGQGFTVLSNGALSYIFSTIKSYEADGQYGLHELIIGIGNYEVFEFASTAMQDGSRQIITVTVLIYKDLQNENNRLLRAWKRTHTEGFGSADIFMPDYDVLISDYIEVFNDSATEVTP